MKYLILLLTLSASCGKTAPRPDIDKPDTQTSPKNNQDGTASTTTNLDWSEGAQLPNSFKLPIGSAALTNEDKFILKDSANQHFIFDIENNTVVLALVSQDALTFIGSQNYRLASETSAWSLVDSQIRWVRWGATKKDLAVTSIQLDSIYPAQEVNSVKLLSVRDNGALLAGISKSVHIRIENSNRQLREFKDIVTPIFQATAFGHIFKAERQPESLTRLIESKEPRWHKHIFQNKNLPDTADFVRYEVGGSADALTVIGIAAVGKKLWITRPALLGSTTDPATDSGSSDKPSGQKLSKEAENLFIQYCAICHEGRSPVFVTTSESGKQVNFQTLLREKEKIISLMNLPPDDPKVMPPYGRPKPTEAELKTMSEF
ncbi:MAG: hypothetical protein RJB13_1071 [Pseudomonadota bacterium]